MNKILTGPIWQRLLIFFIPIYLGSVFQQFYSITDAIVVGNFLGIEALAAIDATSILTGLFINFFVGIGGGAGVVISRYFGAKDFFKVKIASFTAMFISVISGLLITLIGLSISEIALISMNVPVELLDMSLSYIRIYFIGAVFLTIYNVASGVIRATGDSISPFVVLVLGTILNIFLDIFFVITLSMGVEGAAYATITSMAFTALLSIIILVRKDKSYNLQFMPKHLSKAIFISIFVIGIPLGLEALLYDFSNIIIRSVINTYGTEVMAAWGVLNKIDMMAWMILNAFGITVTTFVGQNFGAGNFERVKKSVRVSYMILIPTILLVSTFILGFINPISKIFVQDENVIAIIREVAFIICPFFALFIPTKILSGVIRGTGQSFVPMIVSLLGSCVLRVIWVMYLSKNNGDLNLVFLSYPVTWFITSLVFTIYYTIYSRRVLSEVSPIKA